MFFYIIVCDQSFLVFMSKIQKHIKSRKSKKFDQHCCVLSQAYFACTFVLMVLCIYEHSLFPMHSYHCVRNDMSKKKTPNQSLTGSTTPVSDSQVELAGF